MWFWKNKNGTEKLFPLSLNTRDGQLLVKFPGKVISPLRHMISSIIREEPFPAKLAVTAALRQEGTSYIARAMATTLAHDLEKTVCLVELNWWWPSTPEAIVRKSPGLTAVLEEKAGLHEALVPTSMSGFEILPPGQLPAQQRPIVARSSTLVEVITELGQHFDHLILDTPAILATNDAIPLVSLGDACCMVIRHGITSIEDERLALDDVDHLRILGVVMNQVHYATPDLIRRLISQK